MKRSEVEVGAEYAISLPRHPWPETDTSLAGYREAVYSFNTGMERGMRLYKAVVLAVSGRWAEVSYSGSLGRQPICQVERGYWHAAEDRLHNEHGLPEWFECDAGHRHAVLVTITGPEVAEGEELHRQQTVHLSRVKCRWDEAEDYLGMREARRDLARLPETAPS